MSRSRKKRPGGGLSVASSDKCYKQSEHRRERAAARSALHLGSGDLPAPKRFGNPWSSPKDGKQYWTNHDAAWMRE